MPMYAAISFIFVVPPLIKRIVHEKETGVKVRNRCEATHVSRKKRETLGSSQGKTCSVNYDEVYMGNMFFFYFAGIHEDDGPARIRQLGRLVRKKLKKHQFFSLKNIFFSRFISAFVTCLVTNVIITLALVINFKVKLFFLI